MLPSNASRSLICCAAGSVWLAAMLCARAEVRPDGADFFEKHIRPVLVERCYKCHSAQSEKLKGGLRLDSPDGVLKGGENGPVIVPGHPEKSRLIEAIGYQNEDLQMPPPKQGKLSESQIADFVAWVKMGVPDPRTNGVASSTVASAITQPAYDFAAVRRLWAFRKPLEPPIPPVKNKRWPRSPIDHFILAKLEANHLTPARQADKRTLIRRATFDLAGLPPTPEECEDYLNDRSPDAFAKVVDRLLASPRYGERWGRHWLDVVRYTDSFDARGLGGEGDVSEAYRYRDWVVDAFNRDLPYDRFVVDQFAGDLLATNRAGGFDTNALIATGVMVIGEWGTGDADKEKMLTDIVADQIDVTGRAFLGLTLGCARCHDHKFDPIPTEDYYSLAGIFFSSHILPGPGLKTAGSPVLRLPLAPPAEIERRNARQARVKELEKEIQTTTDRLISDSAKRLLPETLRYLSAVRDYRQTRAEAPVGSLTAFAKERGLSEPVLRRWLELSGSGELALLTAPVKDLLGHTGLNAWRNASGADTPSVTVNATDQEVSFITIKLAAHSLAVHPSPKGGIAVGWRSPITGSVRVSGRVVDADPNCGDGVGWTLSLRSGGAQRLLASGAIVNGGAQALSDGQGAVKLNEISIRSGEVLALAVLPKADYSCDTTVLDWNIVELGGQKRVWDVAKEVVPDLHAGNPHRDGFGNARVWHFYDVAGQPGFTAPAGSALAKWLALVGANDSRPGSGEIEAAARAVQAELLATDGDSPAGGLRSLLLDPHGTFWSALRNDPSALPGDVGEPLMKLKVELADLKSHPLPPLPVAHGLQEGGVPESVYAGIHDAHIQVRGRYDRLGPVVARRFPRLLAGDDRTPITEGSGRLQLARWIASADNPLTARVMVNRIWQHHFAEGIVRTPNNFGKLGTPPTHPELLDYLACEFVKSGWSIKAMHRAILLSAAYQQSDVPDAGVVRADPENKLFGRMNRQRLEAEAIRDNLLAVAGDLDLSLRGPALRDLSNRRRTLYLMTIRSDRSNYRMLFDAADPVSVVEGRMNTTVAPQALFLLNNPFVLDQVKLLAERVRRQRAGDDRGKIEWLYGHLYGRPPSPRELEIGLAALQRGRDAARAGSQRPDAAELAWEEYCQVLVCANEFVYVD